MTESSHRILTAAGDRPVFLLLSPLKPLHGSSRRQRFATLYCNMRGPECLPKRLKGFLVKDCCQNLANLPDLHARIEGLFNLCYLLRLGEVTYRESLQEYE